MSFLEIPDAGLQLDSPPSSRNYLPMQAFGITLNDNMIEEMIRSVQKGNEIELILGSSPSFQYGSTEQDVTVLPDSVNYDLYLTNGGKTQRLPNATMSLLKKPPTTLSNPAKQTKKPSKPVKNFSRASSSGVDSDADTRTSSNSQRSATGSKFSKNGSKPLPTGRSAMASVLSSTAVRSLPSSPGLNGVSSPNPAFSASQQTLEKNRGQRTALVHELAAGDQSFEHLRDVWSGAEADLQGAVEKVASLDKATDKWNLKKIYWKELDVWNYAYDTSEDRQSAIDNAIRQYDKQRIGTSDPIWERLLPKEERGKGKILSKLQATIAKQGAIPPAPKIQVQKAEEGNRSDADSAKSRGEAMSRSSSQPISKPKKANDAQTKRLLSNKPKPPKSSPKKWTAKAKAAEESNKKRVLSEEFVYDTDTSEDEAPLSQSAASAPKPKPKPKPLPKLVEKPVEKSVGKVADKVPAKSKEPPAPSPALKAKPKSVVRAPRAPIKAPAPLKSPQKRPREEDESSSSSGAPLSKRNKPKELPKPMPEKTVKHRASDASQQSRGTSGTVSSNFTMKSKNTSPTKSSPLAISPPTNASDFEDRSSSQRPPNHSQQRPSQQPRVGDRARERERDRGLPKGSTNGTTTSISTASSASSTVMVNKSNKRPREREPDKDSPESTPTPPAKKPRIPKEVMVLARKFSQFYEKYEVLHHEVAAMKDPPDDKMADLLEMRGRLVKMKSDIQQRAVSSGA
ncbi:hypothetical protein GGR57DRAFT_177336 [Xylariaceae sp. FL1272]|nr:hypothetical protein GGR57DRAFT_177336 [Xylariaceae sp. FL1272]